MPDELLDGGEVPDEPPDEEVPDELLDGGEVPDEPPDAEEVQDETLDGREVPDEPPDEEPSGGGVVSDALKLPDGELPDGGEVPEL